MTLASVPAVFRTGTAAKAVRRYGPWFQSISLGVGDSSRVRKCYITRTKMIVDLKV